MLPDVQQREPEIKIPLTRVGVNSVRKMVRVKRKEGKRNIVLLANFECFVDLPAFQKGTHMSRNIEAINEIIYEISGIAIYRIEDLCRDIVEEILKRHSYASYSEVNMKSRLMVHSRSPQNNPQQNFITLIAKARAFREAEGLKVVTEVGAESEGIILHYAGDKSVCTQRAKAMLTVESHGKEEVRIEDIIEILESSLSARTYSFLTEKEEAEVLYKACEAPKSARDVVNEILEKSGKRFFFLPDNARISASCRAKEPLFNFEVVDEKSAAIKELR